MRVAGVGLGTRLGESLEIEASFPPHSELFTIFPPLHANMPVSQYILSPVYFIRGIYSIYYPADSISLVYFIPRQDILSLHGDQGMSQSSSQSVLTEQ